MSIKLKLKKMSIKLKLKKKICAYLEIAERKNVGILRSLITFSLICIHLYFSSQLQEILI